MATRIRRDRVEVHRGTPPQIAADDTSGAPPGSDRPPDVSAADLDDEVAGHFMTGSVETADVPVSGGDGAEPEMFGVRVSWQSEAVRIEAAEFLVATRVEEERRIRIASDLGALRALGHRDP